MTSRETTGKPHLKQEWPDPHPAGHVRVSGGALRVGRVGRAQDLGRRVCGGGSQRAAASRACSRLRAGRGPRGLAAAEWRPGPPSTRRGMASRSLRPHPPREQGLLAAPPPLSPIPQLLHTRLVAGTMALSAEGLALLVTAPAESRLSAATALTSPCSVAFRYQRTASEWPCLTP